MEMYNYGTIAAGPENQIVHNFSYCYPGQTYTLTMSFLRRIVFPEGEHDIIASVLETQLPNVNVYICKQSQPNIANAIASSTSTRNNVEKMTFTIPEQGSYVIVVQRTDDSIPYETEYGVAWKIHPTEG